MSSYFEKVKARMIAELNSSGAQTPDSWADIMLRYSCRMTTDEDQESFLTWIMNPHDSLDIPVPKFETIKPVEHVKVPLVQTIGSDVFDVKTKRNGFTEYIIVNPRTDDIDDEKNPELIEQ